MFVDILLVWICASLIIFTVAYYTIHLHNISDGKRADALRWSDAEWERIFEPNRVNVPEYPAYDEADQIIDHNYLRELRLSQSSLILPDDHLPHDWQSWGDKRGLR